MTALLDVALRTAEAANQEVAQPLFGTRQVVSGVHRPQDVVARDLAVEGGNEASETLLADKGVEIGFFHWLDCRGKGRAGGVVAPR